MGVHFEINQKYNIFLYRTTGFLCIHTLQKCFENPLYISKSRDTECYTFHYKLKYSKKQENDGS